MRKRIFCFIIVSLQLQSQAQSAFQNIMIGKLDDPNEPSLVISPIDTNEMMAAANIKRIYFSHDGGKTWNTNLAHSQWGIFGDPCLIADTLGNFYYFHLANNSSISVWPRYADRIVCQRTDFAGTAWQVDSYAGNNVGHMQDKEWRL
jgi:hypothetical protein